MINRKYLLMTLFVLVVMVGSVFAQSNSITVGDTVTGTADDEQVDYTLSLSEGETIIIDLVSDEFDTYLEVLDEDGATVGFNDDGGEGFNSQLEFSAGDAGDYILRVRAFAGNANGDYTLTVTGEGGSTSNNGNSGNNQDGMIAVGDTITDTSRARVEYAIDLQSEEVVQISLTSPDFDTYLELYDESGSQVATNDDGGEGLNSLLVYTVIDAGTYTIRVRAFGSDNADGRYTLSVTASTVILEIDGGELTYGETVTIEPNSAITTVFNFSASEGDTVNIIVISSSGEDSRLYLYDPNGAIVAEDDDSGEGTNPLVARLTLPVSGTYTLEIQGYGERAMISPFDVTLEQTQLLLLNEGMQTLTLGQSLESDTVALDVEADSEWLITITASQDSASTLYVELREESESYAETRISFSSLQVITFVYTPESDGRVQIGLQYYAYDGDTTFEITAEPLGGQADDK